MVEMFIVKFVKKIVNVWQNLSHMEIKITVIVQGLLKKKKNFCKNNTTPPTLVIVVNSSCKLR